MELNRLQKTNQAALNPVLGNVLVNGRQIKSVTLNPTGTPTIVPHGLGRSLQGFKVTRIRGNFNVWDSQDTNTSPSTTLVLNSSSGSAQVVDLYVF